MNPESPTPREQLEARLTALLLHELPAEEAAALRENIAQNPELAALEARLAQTIAIVREAGATPATEAAEQSAPLRLSAERREKLLAHFKTVTPQEFVTPRRRQSTRVVVLEIAALLAVLACVAGLFLPALAKSKAKAQRAMAQNNLKQVGLASRTWEGDYGDKYPTVLAGKPKAPGNHDGGSADQNSPPAVPMDGRVSTSGQSATLDVIKNPALGMAKAEAPANREAEAGVGSITSGTTIAPPAPPAMANIVLPPTSDTSAEGATWSLQMRHQSGNAGIADGSVQQTADLTGRGNQFGVASPADSVPLFSFGDERAAYGGYAGSGTAHSVATATPSRSSLFVGQGAPSEAMGLPPSALSSANSDVLRIEGSKVVGVGPGTTTVSATLANNTTVSKEVTVQPIQAVIKHEWTFNTNAGPTTTDQTWNSVAGTPNSSLFVGRDADEARVALTLSGDRIQDGEAEKKREIAPYLGRGTAPAVDANGNLVDANRTLTGTGQMTVPAAQPAPLETRNFEVDGNTFQDGLTGVAASSFGGGSGGGVSGGGFGGSGSASVAKVTVSGNGTSQTGGWGVTGSLSGFYDGPVNNDGNANYQTTAGTQGSPGGRQAQMQPADQAFESRLRASIVPDAGQIVTSSGLTTGNLDGEKPAMRGRNAIEANSAPNTQLGWSADDASTTRTTPYYATSNGIPNNGDMGYFWNWGPDNSHELAQNKDQVTQQGFINQNEMPSRTEIRGFATNYVNINSLSSTEGGPFQFYDVVQQPEPPPTVLNGGTAPSLAAPAAVNPVGNFPGTTAAPPAVGDQPPLGNLFYRQSRQPDATTMKGGPAVVSDGVITSGLRNQLTPESAALALGVPNARTSERLKALKDVETQYRTSDRQNGTQDNPPQQRQQTLSQNFNSSGPNQNAPATFQGGQQFVTSTLLPKGGFETIYQNQNGQSVVQTGPNYGLAAQAPTVPTVGPNYGLAAQGVTGSTIGSSANGQQPNVGSTFHAFGGNMDLYASPANGAPAAQTDANSVQARNLVNRGEISTSASGDFYDTGVLLAQDSLERNPGNGGGRRGGGGGGGFGGGGGGRGASTRAYPNASAPGPVTVDYDPQGQKLVLLTDDKSFESVSNLVQQLDQPRNAAENGNNFVNRQRYFNQGDMIVATNAASYSQWGSDDGTINSPAIANSNAFFVDQFRVYNGVLPQSNVDLDLATGPLQMENMRRAGTAQNQSGLDVYRVNVVGYVNVPSNNTTVGDLEELKNISSAPGAPPVVQQGEENLAATRRVREIAKTSAPVPAAPQAAPAVAEDRSTPQAPAPLLVPQPETLVQENAFSTFSLNVSDVAFKLSAASLQQGRMPDPGSVRSEEFINAFDYRDPDPAPGQPVGFAWERARYPFAHNRDLLRFSIKTASAGRQPGRPLNLVLLLDNSGSMERADRVAIIREALRVLAAQLQPGDKISIVTFSRTARLWVDGIAGDRAGQVLELISELTPEGGTNLGDALDLAYATALRHYMANGVNRVVVLTDGAANLGNVNPETLKLKVQAERAQGIALDCFGIGWEDYNDDLLEVLTRNGDGRYGFINSPEDAAEGFAGQLAGALHVAASDVKVQVEFNPNRVISYRQIGYAKHQLTKEQFRDNTVHAAQIGAAEAGNGLYTVELNPQGTGPICTVRLRYRDPGTSNVSEKAWDIPYNGEAVSLDQASPAMRLAATASAFSEWLAQSPFAGDVTTDQLLNYLNGVPAVFGADTRAQQLEAMIRQAKSLTGK